jgi:hypothetical protein
MARILLLLTLLLGMCGGCFNYQPPPEDPAQTKRDKKSTQEKAKKAFLALADEAEKHVSALESGPDKATIDEMVKKIDDLFAKAHETDPENGQLKEVDQYGSQIRDNFDACQKNARMLDFKMKAPPPETPMSPEVAKTMSAKTCLSSAAAIKKLVPMVRKAVDQVGTAAASDTAKKPKKKAKKKEEDE